MSDAPVLRATATREATVAPAAVAPLPAVVDPLGQLRHRLRIEAWVYGIVVLGTCVWAMWPLSTPTPETLSPSDVEPPAVRATPSELAINWSAFDAPIWNPTPPPPTPVTYAPPPPLKIQLLAISTERDAAGKATLVAVIYDPDADAVRFVREGESVAGRRVQTVSQSAVVVADAAGPRSISLDTDAATGGAR